MKYYFYWVCMAILLSSCTIQRVDVDYNRDFDFSALKTFSIQELGLEISDLDKQRIRNQIINELATKNLVYDNRGEVSLRISAVEYLHEKEPSTNAAFAFGGGFGGGTGFGSVGLSVPVGGTIQRKQDFNVAMHDAVSGEMLWLGILQITMTKTPSAETRVSAIKKGVNKLFANYPPVEEP